MDSYFSESSRDLCINDDFGPRNLGKDLVTSLAVMECNLMLDLLFFLLNWIFLCCLFYLKIGTERIGLDAAAAGDNLSALGLNLDSTGPGVFDALFSSFSMILVTEVRLLSFFLFGSNSSHSY